MIFRQKENFQKHLIRIAVMLFVVLLIITASMIYIRNQSIENQLTQIMTQTEKRLEAESDPAFLQKELSVLPEDAVYLVMSHNEDGTTYEEGQRSLVTLYSDIQREEPLLLEGNPAVGSTIDGYWALTTIDVDESNRSYDLLYKFSKSYFGLYNRALIFFFLIIIAILVAVIYIIYHSVMNMISEPVLAMKNAINSLKDPDLESGQFEYVGGRFKELDDLGDTVTNIENTLSHRYTELMNSEQRLTVLLDHLNLGVILIDSSGVIELFNPEATEILGLSEDSYGRSYAEVVRSTQLVDMIDTVIDSQTDLTEEVELYIPNQRFVDVNIIPYLETEKEQGAVLVLLYDISQIQRLEAVRTEFVANASHELRTPVTSIKGFAETLRDGALEDKAIAKEFVQIILNESNRLEHIINDILELSRVEKQKDTAAEAVFDIADVVKTILTSLKKKASMKNINLIAHIDQTSPLLLEGNQHRVEQILTNLVDNAINYSGEDSEVSIRVYGVASGVKIEVSDNGIGIPEEEYERIFERFYRVDKGRSRNSGGTGLGLSIVRNLVRIFGGDIKVKSALGEGSTFIVYLPFRQK